jgi:hypothetical protein
MSHSDKDENRITDKQANLKNAHKKHLKHHRNLNDSISRLDDIDDDDFFYETKEKFHRGR